jgi:hypothetical protein
VIIDRTVVGRLDGNSGGHHRRDLRNGARNSKAFVEEGAYVFIARRRKEKLDGAVKLIGRNITGLQGDGV